MNEITAHVNKMQQIEEEKAALQRFIEVGCCCCC
jgi:hypothetical protein